MAVATQFSSTNYQPGQLRIPGGLVGTMGRMIRLWRSRSRERQAFAACDYRDLRDLGASRWDVERELSKPFWRG